MHLIWSPAALRKSRSIAKAPVNSACSSTSWTANVEPEKQTVLAVPAMSGPMMMEIWRKECKNGKVAASSVVCSGASGSVANANSLTLTEENMN